MAQKTHLFLLAILTLSVALILSGVSATGDDQSNNADNVGVGAWQVVEHPEQDPHVQEIIQFVLVEHNALAKTQLKFEKIIKVERYYANGGTMEKLVIAAEDGGATKTCEAVVWVKPWINYKKLTSFKIIV